MKTWDSKADFDEAYDIGLEPFGHPNTRPERRGGYVREALFNADIPYLDSVTPEWKLIISHFGWMTNTSICIIGVGFGWSIEYLNSRGYADVWGVDNSLYIQGVKDEIDPFDGMKRSQVSPRIYDADLLVTNDLNRFLLDSGHRKNANGEVPFDVCVTERMLTSLSDAEAVALSGDIRNKDIVKIGGQVIHIEVPLSSSDGQRSDMNWKILIDWKTLLPNDTIIRSGGGEFL